VAVLPNGNIPIISAAKRDTTTFSQRKQHCQLWKLAFV